MLKRLLNLIIPRAKDSASSSAGETPRVIPRDSHNVSRRNISSAALKVIKLLNEAGFEAYLVGGGVRDLLLGGHPNDFDVATNATP